MPEKVATSCTEVGHRLPKQALQYKPKGRRNIRRPRKTNFILRIKEEETRLTLQEHDDDIYIYRKCGTKLG